MGLYIYLWFSLHIPWMILVVKSHIFHWVFLILLFLLFLRFLLFLFLRSKTKGNDLNSTTTATTTTTKKKIVNLLQTIAAVILT